MAERLTSIRDQDDLQVALEGAPDADLPPAELTDDERGIWRDYCRYYRKRLEVIRGAEFFEWDAGEAMRTYGRIIPAAPGHKFSVHHQPVGVVAAFSPWNFPMSQPARKIAGALASGCSVILKAAAGGGGR